jgi:rod shape determining protein RodA
LIAYTTPIPSAQFIVIGVMTLLCFQMFVNVSMTVGMAPITGLPLPFVSYGGSSLLFNLMCMALVISITGRKSTP